MSAAVVAVVAAGCGSEGSTTTSGEPGGVGGDITVFAAASLTEAFGSLGEAFEAANPATSLTFSFASSSDLVRQIVEGAPADVFVSADFANMAKLTDAEANLDEPVVFATNTAEIIVGPGNPLGVRGLGDLADDLVVLVCAPEVPCGSYAQEVIAKSGVEVTPDSLEENVKAVVAKVTLGEADAGIVYATDVIAAGDAASGVEIPAAINVSADYPIATTTAASDPASARAFVDFVLSPAGQRILASHGFGGR